MNCQINSLYLCVRDMDRAVMFYEDFFERRVTERDEIYSIFVIGGFRLGLQPVTGIDFYSLSDSAEPALS